MATILNKIQVMPDVSKEDKLYPQFTYKALDSLRTDKRSLSHMIGELIDNSKDAGATKVNIKIHSTEKNNYVERVTISDNGVGMSKDTLEGSFQIGFSRNYSAHDIGKFGLGGTKSCLEKGNVKKTVTSEDGKSLLGRSYDMNQIKEEDRYFTFSLPKDDIKKLWSGCSIDHDDSGTVIEISELLRQEQIRKIKENLPKFLGETFRSFIQTGELEINLKFPDNIEIKVRPTCPAGSDLEGVDSCTEDLIYNGQKIATVTQNNLLSCNLARSKKNRNETLCGIYFSRNGRLVCGPLMKGDDDWSGGYIRHPRYRHGRVLIDFPVEQDDLFGITNDKEHVDPDDALMDCINNVLSDFWMMIGRLTEQKKTKQNAAGAAKVLENGKLNANKPFMNPKSKANRGKTSTKSHKTDNVILLKPTPAVKYRKANKWVEEVKLVSWGDEAVPWKYDDAKKIISFNEDNLFIKERFANQPEAFQEIVRDIAIALISANTSHKFKLETECPDQLDWHQEFLEQFYKKLRGMC